jgi:hypothetical protein
MVAWLQSVDMESLVKLLPDDTKIPSWEHWLSVMREAQQESTRLESGLSQYLALLGSGSRSAVDENDVALDEIRQRVFRSIPTEVWDEASSGFGDPELADM